MIIELLSNQKARVRASPILDAALVITVNILDFRISKLCTESDLKAVRRVSGPVRQLLGLIAECLTALGV